MKKIKKIFFLVWLKTIFTLEIKYAQVLVFYYLNVYLIKLEMDGEREE